MSFKDSLISKFGLGCVERELEGVTLYIRKLSSTEAEKWQFDRINRKTGQVDYERIPGMRSALVYQCLCDAEGKPLFGSKEEIGEAMGNDFIVKCFDICQDVNGMKAEATKEAGKNS